MPKCMHAVARNRARKAARTSSRHTVIIMSAVFAACLGGFGAMAGCDPRTPSTRQDLETDALKLFETKQVIKDPASNLCLVILDGDLADRPVFQTYLIRCKSLAHVADPVPD